MNIPKKYQSGHYQIIHFDQIHSTNDYAWNLISNSNPIDDIAIVADDQTKGAGQYGRKWESRKGENLTFTVVIAPSELHISNAFHLNIITSLAIKNTINELLNIEVKIKWPNDIYYQNSKLCGILIKNKVINNFIKQSIIGIGLNVNQTHFSKNLKNPTSIKQITNKTFEINQILSRILEHIHTLRKAIKQNGIDLSCSEYNNRLYRKNELHSYVQDGIERELTIKHVSASGIISLEDAYGKEIKLSSGLEYIL